MNSSIGKSNILMPSVSSLLNCQSQILSLLPCLVAHKSHSPPINTIPITKAISWLAWICVETK